MAKSLTACFAYIFILSLIILIPLSSEAFNSIILLLQLLSPNKSRAKAKIVEVFPDPDGP